MLFLEELSHIKWTERHEKVLFKEIHNSKFLTLTELVMKYIRR